MSDDTQKIDLDAYFRRIGYDGRREPTLAMLAALHRLHPQAIAFENLDPLLRRPVRLDAESLQHKLIAGGRGGYCFEHNLLFMNVLRTLGFEVSGLAARVIWGRPEDVIAPRGHMLLRVELADGTFLADVGFGGLTLTGPLRFEAGTEQKTPHETFRLDREENMFIMRANVGGDWRALYKFGLEEQFEVDYEVSNYFLSTNPESHFIHTLIAARAAVDGRHALLNNRLTFHGRNGNGERRELATAEEVGTVLREIFGIAVPQDADLAGVLRREAIV